MSYYCGIDPGATGGIAVIDERGLFIAAHRWQTKDPALLYKLLVSIRGEIYNSQVYLERIQSHPGEGIGHVVNNMALVENFGIWKGFILAASLVPVLVHPVTWQNAVDLARWQAKAKANPAAPTPLTLARRLWPSAPLDCLADDGKAVALLLADLARRDSLAGLDRAALNFTREIKAKAERAKARKKRREQKALPAPGHDAPIFLPGPPRLPDAPRPLPPGHALPPPLAQRPQVAPKIYMTIGPDGIREL